MPSFLCVDISKQEELDKMELQHPLSFRAGTTKFIYNSRKSYLALSLRAGWLSSSPFVRRVCQRKLPATAYQPNFVLCSELVLEFVVTGHLHG